MSILEILIRLLNEALFSVIIHTLAQKKQTHE